MESPSLNAVQVRRQLPRAWLPFFGRFGGLSQVQMGTIPIILSGRTVVLSAPTASGKTEAVVAPVAELHVRERWPGLAVLYVVPTRALGNDMIRRLEGPLAEMQLAAVLKHGDRPTLPDREFRWLLTTPESLDSLISRRPQLLQSLRTVIVDEIHLLDNTYRGDQMRVLLARLRQLVEAPALTVHLLSATLNEPEAVGQRYTEAFEVVTVGTPRPIQSHLFRSLEETLAFAKLEKKFKILVFCNKRQSVEETAQTLKPLWHPYPVVAHHGSLDRRQREESEEVMKHSRVAICVATGTLEIGIDIGDIDLVVLAEPPWTLEALQQRVGRGSRRLETIQAAAIYHTEEERLGLEAMFTAAATADYISRDYRPDLSVIVQQTLSLLYQHRTGLTPFELRTLLQTLGSETEVQLIVDHLIEKGMALSLRDRVYPSSELLDLGELGEIHSNVPDSGDHTVVNIDTGREVGHISGAFGSVFLLAGQAWRVVRAEKMRVLVRRHAGPGAAALFAGQRNVGRFHYLLPRDLRQRED